MLETVACQLAAEGQSSNGAAVWFLVLFTMFVGIDSVVNAAALGRTLKIWEETPPDVGVFPEHQQPKAGVVVRALNVVV